MRKLLTLCTILLASCASITALPPDDAPALKEPHSNIRGEREPPGLEQVKSNYEEAKFLVEEAKLLVIDAEKAEELARQKKAQAQNRTNQKMAENELDDRDEAQRAGGDDNDKQGKDIKPWNSHGKTHGSDVQPHDKTPGSSDKDEDVGVIMQGEDPEEKPSVCGKDLDDIQEICKEDRPICKYKKVPNPRSSRGFIISAELADGQDPSACIRRCHKKYGLTPEHCGEGQSCYTEVLTRGDCDVLTTNGDCQYYE